MTEPESSKKRPVSFANAGTPLLVFTEIVFAVMLGAYLASGIFSSSFFGHLALGRWIIANKTVPTEELWMSVGHGMSWTYPAWFFGLSCALLEELAGPRGLLAAKILLFILLVAVLCLSYSSRAKDRFIGACVSAFVSCGILFAAPLGPQLLALIILVLIIELAYHFMVRDLRFSFLLYLFCLSAILANVSPVTSLGIAVAIIFMFVLGKASSDRQLKQNSFVFIFVLLSGELLSPYLGLQLIDDTKRAFNSLSIDLLQQLHPATIYNYPIAFLLLLLFIFAVLFHHHSKSVRFGESLVLVLLVLLAFGSESLLPAALIAAGYACVIIWGRNSGQGFGNLGESFYRSKACLGKIPAKGGLWVLLCLAVVNISRVVDKPYVLSFLPSLEIDYILDHSLSSPLLHEVSVGPYVQYRFSDAVGSPRRLGAIAPRSIGLVPSMARSAELLSSLKQGWKQFYEAISPKTILVHTHCALYEMLKRDLSWKLVFEGGRPVDGLSEEMFSQGWAVFVFVEKP